MYFIPPIKYVSALSDKKFISIRELCRLVDIPCRASGIWANRQIAIQYGKECTIRSEPGDWGKVKVTLPAKTKRKQAQIALCILAYGLHDLVAKESIKGLSWSRICPPSGRPRKKRALTNKECQKKYREKHGR